MECQIPQHDQSFLEMNRVGYQRANLPPIRLFRSAYNLQSASLSQLRHGPMHLLQLNISAEDGMQPVCVAKSIDSGPCCKVVLQLYAESIGGLR